MRIKELWVPPDMCKHHTHKAWAACSAGAFGVGIAKMSLTMACFGNILIVKLSLQKLCLTVSPTSARAD